MKSFVETVGIEHKVTSPYYPRTNGQTEKTNGTLIEALRKSIGTDALNWPKYLGWIVMSYNSRQHSTTGFSPFELLVGKRMNNFENFSEIELDWSISAGLEKRSREIRTLVEETLPKAKSNIDKHQEAQKKSQNKQHTIQEEILDIGTKVYVTIPGMHDKLHPKYRGPFTIVSTTPFGNYILENVMQERMKDSFPLQRLKVVPDVHLDDESLVRFDKILDHRKKGANFEYLVKWHGKGIADSWEPPENFLEQDTIPNYWKNLKAINEGTKRPRGRPRKIKNLTLLALFALFFGLAYAESDESKKSSNKTGPIAIEQNFYFCDMLSSSSPYYLVDINSGCQQREENIASSILPEGIVYREVHILSRNIHEVFGNANRMFNRKNYSNFL